MQVKFNRILHPKESWSLFPKYLERLTKIKNVDNLSNHNYWASKFTSNSENGGSASKSVPRCEKEFKDVHWDLKYHC